MKAEFRGCCDRDVCCGSLLETTMLVLWQTTEVFSIICLQTLIYELLGFLNALFLVSYTA